MADGFFAKQKQHQVALKYRYKRRPYRHQVAALKKLISTGFGGGLLMEPRTGKTQVAIDYASILHASGKVNRVLIVCPVSVIGVWEDEIEAVCPFPHRTVVWDKDGRKEQALPSWGKDILDFVIVNYDAFSVAGKVIGRDKEGNVQRSRKRGGRYDMRKAFKAWQPQLIVLDESHRIKTPSAAKTRSMHMLAQVAPYRVIATGTAVTKKQRVFDIYSQWKFLNPEGWVKGYTLDSFKREFGVFREMTTSTGGRYEKWVKNNTGAVAKLRLRIHQDSFAITREECYDLPPTRHQIIPVDLTGHTAQVYDEMAEEMIAQIKTGEISEASIKLVQSLRLGQITSGFTRTTSEDGGKGRLVRVGRDKLNALEELLTDLYEAEEKVVIAARWRADIAAIMKLHDKMKIPRWELFGGVTRRDRDINIKAFRAHDGPGGFIMQPAAGSLGIDLSSAATMIWFSLTNSYVDFTQARDRIALTPRGAVHMYLLAKGTIDEDMYAGLMQDEDFAKRIHDSPERLLRSFTKIVRG